MARAARLGAAIGALLGDLRGRAALVVLGGLVCQMGLGFGYVFGPLAADIIGEMGWTRGEYSLTRIPQLAVMSLASPLVGALTVRYGGRRVLVGALVVLGLAFVMLGNLTTLHQYYLLMMVVGAGLTGVGDITVGQIVSQWVERSRGMALGIVYIGSNLGGVLLVPLAVALAERVDWRASLNAMGMGALFVMLPICLLLVRDRENRAEAQPGDAADARDAQASDADAAFDDEDDDDGAAHELTGHADLTLRAALRTRSFWILFYALFTFYFYFLALLEHLVLFLTDEGMTRGSAVAAFTVAIGLGIWSKLGLGLVADRIPERASLLLVFAGVAATSLMILGLPHPQLLWVFVFTFGFSYAARDVVYPLILTRCFGLRYMAPIYGAMMTCLVLGASGAWFAARVHDVTGSYQTAFRVFAVLNLVAVGLLFLLRDERKIPHRSRHLRA